MAKAWSIATVIDGHEGEAKFSETDNPGKFPAVLDSADFGGAGFEDGRVPAIFVTDDNRIGYVRPLRGPNDVNADDVFTLAPARR